MMPVITPTAGKTIVKLCGMRTLNDAREATHAGADVLSFTFYAESRRGITPPVARDIVTSLRSEWAPERSAAHPIICGLFVNETADSVRTIAAYVGLDIVQLAGDESPESVAAVGLPVLKTLRPQPDETGTVLATRIARYRNAARSLPSGPFGSPLVPLIDAAVPGAYGGTGMVGDWQLCAALHAEHGAPFMLAGGLTPENVGTAVRIVRPWGVDVASGIERAPGVKDHARMRAFVQAVHAADVGAGTRG